MADDNRNPSPAEEPKNGNTDKQKLYTEMEVQQLVQKEREIGQKQLARREESLAKARRDWQNETRQLREEYNNLLSEFKHLVAHFDHAGVTEKQAHELRTKADEAIADATAELVGACAHAKKLLEGLEPRELPTETDKRKQNINVPVF